MTEYTTDIKDQKCINCRFSLAKHEADASGNLTVLCRRYPPTIIHDETGMRLEFSAWPSVKGDAWCGEWYSDELRGK